MTIMNLMLSKYPKLCPNCKSENIELGDLEQDGEVIEQESECCDCLTKWTIKFEFVSGEITNEPEETDE